MVFVMVQASECRQCEFTPCMCMTASPQLLSPSQAGALSKPALQVALSIFIVEILVHVHEQGGLFNLHITASLLSEIGKRC